MNELKIAFLGLGAMGSRMCAHLLLAQHQVRIWNRDSSKMTPLVNQGAIACDSPRDAATGADFVIAMVRDNQASQSVWLDPENGALAGMGAGTIAVECSTVSIDHVHGLHAAMAKQSVTLLDCPVIGSRIPAENAQLGILMGGNVDAITKVKPILALMGNNLYPTGDSGSAMAIKLAINALLGIQVAALAELFGLLNKLGIDLKNALDIMGSSPTASPAAKMLASLMLTDQHGPQFPVNLLEKDLGYLADAAQELKSDIPVMNAVRQVAGKALQSGLGELNMTALVRLYQD